MVSLDVGCGFRYIITPMDADVSLDLNMDKSSPLFLSRLRNPIIADAETLPFRGGIFYVDYCISVLEHLPNPLNAIREKHRVMVEGGIAMIVIPIDVTHEMPLLRFFFLNFPFSIVEVLGYIRRAKAYHKIKGASPLSDIKPEHITPFFKKSAISFSYDKHRWFVRGWGALFKRLLGRSVRGLKRKYVIGCIK